MRKIEVLGVSLTDLTVRESMRKVEGFLNDGKVSTIAFITMKGLIASQERPEVKEWMNSLDMTVVADEDILHAADVAGRNRIHEIENNVFIQEFLKKLVRGRKSVYLLSQTRAQLEKMEAELNECQEGLKILGRTALEEVPSDDDFFINELNMTMPNVLISNLETPKRESFVAENHMKMNVDIWLMLRADRKLLEHEKGFFHKVYDSLVKKWFHLSLQHYEEHAKEASQRK